jgi:hypothetical protein
METEKERRYSSFEVSISQQIMAIIYMSGVQGLR